MFLKLNLLCLDDHLLVQPTFASRYDLIAICKFSSTCGYKFVLKHVILTKLRPCFPWWLRLFDWFDALLNWLLNLCLNKSFWNGSLHMLNMAEKGQFLDKKWLKSEFIYWWNHWNIAFHKLCWKLLLQRLCGKYTFLQFIYSIVEYILQYILWKTGFQCCGYKSRNSMEFVENIIFISKSTKS